MLSNRMKRGIERVGNKLNGKGESDRVPVLAQIGAHSLRLSGIQVEDFFANPDLFIKTHLSVSEYYKLDTPSFYFDIYNIEAEAMGQSLNWIPGTFPEANNSDMLIKNEKDLDKLTAPDPRRDGRMPFIIEVYKRMLDLGIPPQFRFCAPFSLACNIRGVTNLLFDILQRPEFAHRLFGFITNEVLAPWITVLREECGGDYPAMGADAYASIPVTNLSILEEFALGYIKKLDKQIGGVEVRGWWGEKNLRDPIKLMELKLQGQSSCAIGMDPDVKHIGIQFYKGFAQDRNLPLMIGIDSTLLSQGSKKDIIDRVREYIQLGNSDGRLLIVLNEVPIECPPDNVHTAMQAIHHYGRTDAIFEEDFKPTASPAFAGELN